MGFVEVERRRANVGKPNDIDGATLVSEVRSEPLVSAGGAPCDDAPLTLYGAYRQGFADYLAGRPNPYRIGSRLAGIWHEGHAEAASNDALDFAVRVRFCWGARAAYQSDRVLPPPPLGRLPALGPRLPTRRAVQPSAPPGGKPASAFARMTFRYHSVHIISAP